MSSGAFSSLMYSQIEARVCGSRPDRRLVQEQHPRRVQQAAGDLQPPLHAARVRHDQAVPPVPQADHVQHLLHPRRHRGRRHPVELGVEAQVLLGGQVVVERGVLEHQPDVAPDRVPLGGHVVAGHRWRCPEVGRASVQRILMVVDLPGAVGAEEAERLPRRRPRSRCRARPRSRRSSWPARDLDRPAGGRVAGCRRPAGAGRCPVCVLRCVATLTASCLVHAEPSREVSRLTAARPRPAPTRRAGRCRPPACSSSAARIRYSFRRASVRICCAWATWASLPTRDHLHRRHRDLPISVAHARSRRHRRCWPPRPRAPAPRPGAPSRSSRPSVGQRVRAAAALGRLGRIRPSSSSCCSAG